MAAVQAFIALVPLLPQSQHQPIATISTAVTAIAADPWRPLGATSSPANGAWTSRQDADAPDRQAAPRPHEAAKVCKVTKDNRCPSRSPNPLAVHSCEARRQVGDMEPYTPSEALSRR